MKHIYIKNPLLIKTRNRRLFPSIYESPSGTGKTKSENDNYLWTLILFYLLIKCK